MCKERPKTLRLYSVYWNKERRMYQNIVWHADDADATDDH